MTDSTLSFSEAIAETQSLMKQINSNKISEAQIQEQISSLLKSQNGGRGFFVAYLTSEMSLADNPSSGVIEGLKRRQELSSELLVKNLAMSSAMIVVHNRNSDLEGARGSEKVRYRTSNLIQQLNLQAVETKLQQLTDTLKDGKGEYQNFLQRWGYDADQKKAIQNAIHNL
ncbi:MAG: hypothetical protein AAFO95_13975 [Cyanobacteria bacterium J06600_6]